MAGITTTTATHALLLIFSSIAFFFTFPSTSHQVSSKNPTAGFTTQLIHRNSPLSPFHNPNATASDIWNSAYQRTVSRIAYLRSPSTSSPATIRSLVSSTHGDYIMKLKIGSQQQEILLILDTGSNLVWTQCLPCTSCFSQSLPIFDPSKSSSYRKVLCNYTACMWIQQSARRCSRNNNTCEFYYKYMDESFTDGELAGETLMISSTSGEDVYLYDMVIGCGLENKGFSSPETGLAGFGPSALSLITQLETRVYWRFSYCFVPYTRPEASSHLRFGDGAVLLGNPTKMALALDGPTPAWLYYLYLDDISVGKERLYIPPGTFSLGPSGSGGLVIDSGTTLTVLKRSAYNMLFDKLKEQIINLEPYTTDYKELRLCYKGWYRDLVQKNIPLITFHFRNLDVALDPQSTFAMFKRNVVCLAMIPSDDISIFGNLAQQNMHVGHDLRTQDVYIFPAGDCATV